MTCLLNLHHHQALIETIETINFKLKFKNKFIVFAELEIITILRVEELGQGILESNS